MPGGQERILRRRIKSVQSTKKITRAMELIAASRIVKAQQRVKESTPYAEAITETVTIGDGLAGILCKIHVVLYEVATRGGPLENDRRGLT